MAKEINLEIMYNTWNTEPITIPDEFDDRIIQNIDMKFDEGHVYFTDGTWWAFTVHGEPQIDYKYPNRIIMYDKDWNTVEEFDG